PASASPAAAAPPWAFWAVAFAWSAAGQGPRRPAAATRRTPLAGSAPPAAFGRASPLFSRDLLEHLLVEQGLGQQLLQPGVLAPQLLEPLGLVGLHAAVLVAPAVQGRLADGQPLADLGDGQPLGQVGVGLAQLGDDLFRRVPLHRSSPLPLRGPQRLS